MARPRKYQSPDELVAAVDAYIAQCQCDDEPITWTGMALALGFYGRQELDNYLDYEGFSDGVKRAKLLVENAYEKRLATTTPTGAIFALKNMGWKDKQEIGGTLNVREAGTLSDADLEAIAAGRSPGAAE